MRMALCLQQIDGKGQVGLRTALLCLQQIREGRAGAADAEGADLVVRHHRVPDGDGHTLHAVQGRVQPQVQPAEPGHHQVQQPVHRDCGVQQCGRGELFLCICMFTVTQQLQDCGNLVKMACVCTGGWQKGTDTVVRLQLSHKMFTVVRL